MEVHIRFPQFGDMTDGFLVQWLKPLGSSVTEGEPIVQVETAKALVDIEAPASGRFSKILVEPGANIEIGQALGVIEGQQG